jgi:hypothetical protein
LSIRRQVRATRELTRVVDAASLPLPVRLAETAAKVGLDGSVVLWDDPRACSFTYGLFSPRVAVSRGLADTTNRAELEAVLHHERYHVRNRDTLKMVIARAAPSAFFFLPALRSLRDRYLAGRELAADRRAIRALDKQALAGALYKVIDAPSFTDLGAAAALGGGSFLDQRVEQLEHGTEPPLPRLPAPIVIATAAGLAVLTVALVLTIANNGGDTMSMDPSMNGGIGIAASVLGMFTCVCAWLVGGFLLYRRARRHRGPA